MSGGRDGSSEEERRLRDDRQRRHRSSGRGGGVQPLDALVRDTVEEVARRA
jgi:hypothetical protein